jgi:hypothetical protein
MDARRLDRLTRTTLVAAALLFLLAGAGWAYFGTDIFLNTVILRILSFLDGRSATQPPR